MCFWAKVRLDIEFNVFVCFYTILLPTVNILGHSNIQRISTVTFLFLIEVIVSLMDECIVLYFLIDIRKESIKLSVYIIKIHLSVSLN